MNGRSCTCVLLAVSLLVNAMCIPADMQRIRRQVADDSTNGTPTTSQVKSSESPPPIDDDFDDDFGDPVPVSNNGGGSSIFSLLNLASALSGQSSSTKRVAQKETMEQLMNFIQEMRVLIMRRTNTIKHKTKRAVEDNEIDIDYVGDLKPPPLQRQEESDESSQSNSNSGSEENDAAEQSVEEVENDNASQQNTDSEDDSDSDYDEPPGGGDGQGGGILGILASLSGDEDGQSDLGSLLATVSGIVANLSGDGIDLNSLIASGLGLFVGLLSEGEENPGAVLASYLLTSLDTLTGGGAKNNGAFFGTFLSKLVKGTSAAGDPEDSEENGNNMMSDSAGFFVSLLMSLLGNMSKGSSSSHPWR